MRLMISCVYNNEEEWHKANDFLQVHLNNYT